MALHGCRLAWFATALALLVVLLGAWTRLSHAGLACPDWPGCYGFSTVPFGPVQQALAESRFPQVPLQVGKGWLEMLHRYGAGLLMLSIGLLMVRTWRQRQVRRLSLSLLVLVSAQALFGLWTVTLRLWPPVVTGHLLGGMMTLGLLFLLSLRLSVIQPARIRPVSGLRRLALVALVLVAVQIALGGWVSAHYAAQACPDLPTCQGQWWPPADFAAGFNVNPPLGPDYLGGLHDGASRTAIHLMHRCGALLVSLTLLGLCWQIWRAGLKGLAAVLWLLLLLQLGLGAVGVWLQFPPGLALAHSAGAALLLLWLTLVNDRLWQARLYPASRLRLG